ncbi:MAG: gliding motility-associated C-terminal domain-containing protein [Bacteroidota bacterium]
MNKEYRLMKWASVIGRLTNNAKFRPLLVRQSTTAAITSIFKIRPLVVFLLVQMLATTGWSQACTTLGQNPSSAFPVCGTTFFTQTSVPACGGSSLPTMCGGNAQYSDLNPFWYKFTCYVSGTFGFIITPKNLGDDYDWQLFDITGRNPSDVYTMQSLIVSANWSGSSGVTGAGPSAKNPFECASNPVQNISTFSTMPALIAGHEYLLLVSHFDDATHSQSGYDLSFPTGAQGGTASIVNPVVPSVTNAYGICDGTRIVMKMNKKVNCNSLASNGTDFTVSGAVPISIASAIGHGCSTGFDTDSIILTLNNPLSPGKYKVQAKLGSDGNTLTDNCANTLAVGDIASLTFLPAAPTPMDSISPVVCIKDTLQLIFSRPMDCSSIAADGSDFAITGPATVNVKSAAGVCSNGISTIIRIILTAPIRVNGTFTIRLKNGSDGNTLLDECGFVTPAGSTLPFTTKNITTANFQATVSAGCKYDTVYFTHNAYGGTTRWQWSVDGTVISTLQNPVLVSRAYGPHDIFLSVSNGFCSDTARSSFTFVDHTVKASFAVADTLCPTDTLHFTDRSTANTIAWQWNFGNGVTSTLQFPAAQNYPLTGRRSNYTAKLIAQNSFNCSDTAYKTFTVLASCYVAVPTAFTPNGDGLNDYLYPLNAFKADNLVFRVFNRYGQIIYESKDWTKKWDGRVNSLPQPSGTYVWTLDYVNRDNGQKVSLKGTTVLIR